MESFWEALGRPSLGAPLPGPRTLCWRAACTALVQCLSERGVSVRFRSATVLWRTLSGGLPRAGANWRQLCELGNVDTLLGAMALRGAADGIRFCHLECALALVPSH